ncbi:S26 family signal peptidase [Actinacidiphila bryophytorum]|uniref:S26 family signal peptidase n=1 Tax=Actinacidiphila bryophytorum TaxID=1436133 RepID=UPI002176D515|nr:S26 family signal peptidase [Actinacidiphila bryophytorum]UWE12542.1 S26 family signal peptidase [Actinacidiphila bryophytorum]
MPLLAAVLAVLGARRLLLIVTVEGTSMAPTYAPGRRLLVLRTPLARILVRPGAVVVFRLPRTDPDGPEPPLLVKRVAARAGDPIPPEVRPPLPASPTRVPRGHLILLGDNPSTSTDSRTWGYVSSSTLTAVLLTPLPPAPAR